MKYDFLVETYETERMKVISVWSEFKEEDLPLRLRPGDPRGRSVHEQTVHQCTSEDIWFRTMLSIDGRCAPLPKPETRLEFMQRYAEDSGKRLAALRRKDDAWWEGETSFFDVQRSRKWVMVRRLTHTSHHRGQQLAMLRMLGRDLHSNYGPTADTGGSMQLHARPSTPILASRRSSKENLLAAQKANCQARLRISRQRSGPAEKYFLASNAFLFNR